MTLDALIMLAGGFVAVLPFLGFPNSWDTVLLFIAGVAIIGLGVVARRRLLSGRAGVGAKQRERDAKTFVENAPPEDAHGEA